MNRGGDGFTERTARLRAEIPKLLGKGLGPLSVAVRLGCSHRDVVKVMRDLGLIDPDGRTPAAIAERLGVPLDEYVRERAAGRFRCRPHDGGKGAWLRVKEKSFTHGVEDTCKACCAAQRPEDAGVPSWKRLRGKAPPHPQKKSRVG